jgi:hypothetical protein
MFVFKAINDNRLTNQINFNQELKKNDEKILLITPSPSVKF